MPVIEKTKDSKRKIKQLYDSDSVLFEETLLVSNNIKYSICFVPKAEVYDVIIEDLLIELECKDEKINDLKNQLNNDFNPDLEIPEIHGKGISY